MNTEFYIFFNSPFLREVAYFSYQSSFNMTSSSLEGRREIKASMSMLVCITRRRFDVGEIGKMSVAMAAGIFYPVYQTTTDQ